MLKRKLLGEVGQVLDEVLDLVDVVLGEAVVVYNEVVGVQVVVENVKISYASAYHVANSVVTTRDTKRNKHQDAA